MVEKSAELSHAVLPTSPIIMHQPSKWGEGKEEAPLGRRGSPWVAAGGAGRGWYSGRYVKPPLLAVLGQQGDLTDYKKPSKETPQAKGDTKAEKGQP